MFFPRRPPLSVELLEDRCLPSGSAASPLRPADPATAYRVSAAYTQLPLRFEADGPGDFVSRGSGYALFLAPGGAVLSLTNPATPSRGLFHPTGATDPTVLRMQLVGGNPSARPSALDPLSGVSNYYVGNNPALWRPGQGEYGRVQYQDVYRGVNVVYYGNQSRLEYDFVVSPGADPGAVRLSFQGADSVSLDGAGELVLHTAGGDVIEPAPVLYQQAGGTRQAVAGSYQLLGGGQVGFAVGPYDYSRPLVIDPILSYSTYLGGAAVDQGFAIAVDGAGDAFVTGETSSADFPLQDPAQDAIADLRPDRGDVFVAKFDPTGTHLLYSTFLGGTAEDGGFGIAVDGQGNAYVTGFTSSVDFPTKNGLPIAAGEGDGSAFVAKFDPSGALVYSTYLGGRHETTGHAIAVDRQGDAYVTGLTDTPDFPTVNAFQLSQRGTANAFVTKLGPSGNQIVYSTFLGGD
ncbi:MAG TPA: SBBP repeat-containing protein, partial [Gemmataceae bacterium]|nr:SBBP repeat-containing protein [Gemmataceae bacterium]